MMVLRYRNEIRKAAADFQLKPSLVAAIVTQESAGDPFASRFEPAWRYFKDVSLYARKCRISEETEKAAQAFSYGLMQIMGSVAREHMFIEPLPKLFDVETNLHYGCKHLRKFLDLHKTEERAIVSYNAGSPRILDGKYVNNHYLEMVLLYKTQLLTLDK
jgi:soluble lytic murein transglycosylase-like protein